MLNVAIDGNLNVVFNLGMDIQKGQVARTLIERHGGSSALARLTGYSVQRINNWKGRGIPSEAMVRFPNLFWPAQAANGVSEDAHQLALSTLTTGSSDEPAANEACDPACPVQP